MVKSFLKRIIPGNTWRALRRLFFLNKTRDNIDIAYSGKSVSNIFSDIYANDEWGKGSEGRFKEIGTKFYSGSGSYNRAAEKYMRFVDAFIKENNIKSITDIGCGDFNIGKNILKSNPQVQYVGVDVVKELVDHNNEIYGDERIKFLFLDTLHEPVPKGGLLLIRQVLQHLSNEDIHKLTKNCFPGFKHILVTEHQLKPELLIKKNIDKETGPNIRPAFGSGVFLDAPPFSYEWDEKLIVEDVENKNCQIVTYAVRNND